MTHYVGILDGADDVWGVRVPDLPGCHAGGASPEEAIADATSAVREWAEARMAKHLPLPDARTVADLLQLGGIDSAGGESAVMIAVLIDSGRPVRANLSLDAGLLAAIDAEASRRGLTRSAFIASAAREKIEGHR
ncbi:MAG: ribbon-helix-helix protein, CopG family [Mesorhizobium sp.]|jgi:predicted RNase H-like HicB family nuclease|uniref:type II toxin-antitoxin system HicB family antitoxin n=1 Tax=Mesorhizobium sp. TaxID=1871066 RepID=UPI00120B4370|nr:type II toxin-antitoxin system HicB family antitoxin [Mesorhizobium sp.]TIL59707.1 MAG: ribbon-helix-helix protein, CopG family [Mesorhizobium sp.]TIM13490.1 MAG: ribbon-helix-helix protein, CopG family [Mesorhizobium sp.]TIN39114.1 MAG: ribbon-helix-helix protein, CopG family [Mesorhizobium sp.]